MTKKLSIFNAYKDFFISQVSNSRAPEGLKRVEEAHPDVQIYCAHIDSHLNENKYIVPGLGDAGDRIFGTK